MKSSVLVPVVSLLGIGGVKAALPFKPVVPIVPPVDWMSTALDQLVSQNFTQPIDHSNVTVGTFPMRWWYNATFWKGPGSPVVLMTPGELSADGYTGYLTDQTMPGMIAKAIGAAVVMVEHRYWGTSQPYDIHDTKTLQYLTLENAVADFANFARHVKLPFDTNSSSNAPSAPWIWTGGSYSGALAAWVEALSPDTFWAYHASSGPVEAVYDYWGYFLPIQHGMPRNCSSDLSAIVEYVDKLMTTGDPREQYKVKQMFGLEGLSHNDDFASAIGYPLGNWQSIQLYSGYSGFFEMCDAIEGMTAATADPAVPTDATNSTTAVPEAPGPDGVGLTKALANFSKWFKDSYLPWTCHDYGYADWRDKYSVACFDSYNTSSPGYTDQSPNGPWDRAWIWMTCNQPFFYWQTGAPADKPTIVSRLVSADYYQRQCEMFFPEVDGFTYSTSTSRGAKAKTAEQLNAQTGGWMFPTNGSASSVGTPPMRIVWSNGEFDPWRSASVSSELRPGGPLASTASQPVYLMADARHCNDLLLKNGLANAGVMSAINGIVATMKGWTADFYKANGLDYSMPE